MEQLLTTIGGLVVLIMLGSVLKAFHIMSADFAPVINRVVLTVTLPALVFRAILLAGKQQQYTLEVLKLPLLAVGVIGGCGLVAYGGARLLRLDRARTGVFLLAGMFGSTAFVGYPLFAALGRTGDPNAAQMNTYHVFYSELGLLVPLVTVGFVVAAHYGEGQRFTWGDLLAIPRSAPFIAMLLGLLFYRDDLFPLISNTVSVLADSTSFLMMFSLGLTIVWRELGTNWQANLLAGGVRLLVGPLLAVILAALLGMDPVMSRVAILDSAMPAILLSLVYAAQFKLDVKFASSLVFTSFLLSLPTLVIVLLLTTPQ